MPGIPLVVAFVLLLPAKGESVPTEETIAYLHLTGDFWQVWSIASDGSRPRQLTETPVDKTHLAWRPGSSELLYQTNRGETFVLDVERGTTLPLPDTFRGRDPRFSPSGGAIVYEKQPDDLHDVRASVWIARPDGSEARKLCEDATSPSSPVFLSEDVVLHARHERLLDRSTRQTLSVVDVESGSAHRPLSEGGDVEIFDVAASPQGELAFAALEKGFYEIWVSGPSGDKARAVTSERAIAGNPSWCDDGRRLAFELERERDGVVQLYRVDSDGGNLVRLTDGTSPSRHPVWRRSTATESSATSGGLP